MFDFGLHVISVHLYNFSETSIANKDVPALSFLEKISVIKITKNGENIFENDAIQKFCAGDSSYEVSIQIDSKHLT